MATPDKVEAVKEIADKLRGANAAVVTDAERIAWVGPAAELPRRIPGVIDDILLRARHGTIVNITSDAAIEPYEGWGGYGSSKAALEHLQRCHDIVSQEGDVVDDTAPR